MMMLSHVSTTQPLMAFQVKPKRRNVKNLALTSNALNPLQLGLTATIPATPTVADNNNSWVKHQRTTYANGPMEILPNLYLGDETNATSPEQLKKLNIGFVLNVAKEVENQVLDFESITSWRLLNVSSKTLFVKKHKLDNGNTVYSKKLYWDHNQEDITDFFPSAFSFIDAALSRNLSVLIHCQCGVSRSASLMLAYVMSKRSLSFEQAYQLVKSKSKVISPNLSLITQLMQFERDVVLKPSGETTNSFPDIPKTPIRIQ